MWELMLASRHNRKNILEYIHSRVLTLNVRILSTCHSDEQFDYLLFAVDVLEGKDFLCRLKKIISDYIADEYKYDYILGRLKRLTNFADINDDYVRILSLLDRETDEEMLIKMLPSGDKIFIDSFIDFRLEPLTKRWNEICNLALGG